MPVTVYTKEEVERLLDELEEEILAWLHRKQRKWRRRLEAEIRRIEQHAEQQSRTGDPE